MIPRMPALCAAALLLTAAVPALAQTSVTQNPPVPARPPVTTNLGPAAGDTARPPPDRIAAPDTSTAGPGLAGGGIGAPLTGSGTQVPVTPPSQR